MTERVFLTREVIATGCIVAPKGFLAGTTYCGIKTIKIVSIWELFLQNFQRLVRTSYLLQIKSMQRPVKLE